MYELDNYDIKIVKHLIEDPDITSKILATEIELGTTATHERKRRLFQEKIIGSELALNYTALELPISLLIYVKLEKEKNTSTSVLFENPHVEEIIELFSDNFDIILKSFFSNNKQLEQFKEELKTISSNFKISYVTKYRKTKNLKKVLKFPK